MLPYDGEPVHAPSTSAWAWDPTFSLYFNTATHQWAKPRPDGGWDYAGGHNSAPTPQQPDQPPDQPPDDDDDDPQPSADDDRTTSHRVQVSYDDVATAVPEEQLWPASDDDNDDLDPADRFSSAPLLRLVVHRRPDPAVLPLAHTVASLDPAEPVSIGRDKSFERRIRLRELAVSKTHCTLFWAHGDGEGEGEGGHWAVVDNGSTHGTFVGAEGGEDEVRLSDPKVASTPKRLHHLDTIRTGSTTFAVHIHASFACTACSVASDSSNLIPLVAAPSDSAPSASTPAYTGSKTKAQKEQDRREQMALLRGKLLKPAPGTSSSSTSSSPAPTPRTTSKPATSSPFIDRAAARRERNALAAPSPFFAVPGRSSSSTATAAAAAPASSKPAATPAAADPFSSDSRGAQLLSKLSGSSGAGSSSSTTAGAPSARLGAGAGAGLGTLVEARTYADAGAGEARDVRPGLGSRPLVVGVERVGEARSGRGAGGAGAGAGEGKRDWRGEGRERSYKRLREGD
ncbi:hypothetical protein JCM3775_003428 [Rhodotorula graminis]